MPTNVLVKEEFVPAMPANAHVKVEDELVPPMPDDACIKEEAVPAMPTDACVKIEDSEAAPLPDPVVTGRKRAREPV